MIHLFILAFIMLTNIQAKSAIETLQSTALNPKMVKNVENIIENGRTGNSNNMKNHKFGFRKHGTNGEYMIAARSIGIAALNAMIHRGKKGIIEPNYLEGSDNITGEYAAKVKKHRQASQQIHMFIKRIAQHFSKNPNDIFEAIYDPSKVYKKSYNAFTGKKVLSLNYISHIIGRTFVLDALSLFWDYIKINNQELKFNDVKPNSQQISNQPAYVTVTKVNLNPTYVNRIVNSSALQSLKIVGSSLPGVKITDTMQAFSYTGDDEQLIDIASIIKTPDKLKVMSISLNTNNSTKAAQAINHILQQSKNLKYLRLGAYDEEIDSHNEIMDGSFRKLFNKINLRHNKDLVGLDLSNLLVNFNINYMVNIPKHLQLKFLRILGMDERYLKLLQKKIKQGNFVKLEELVIHLSNMQPSNSHKGKDLQIFLEFLQSDGMKKMPNLRKIIIRKMPTYKAAGMQNFAKFMRNKHTKIIFFTGNNKALVNN